MTLTPTQFAGSGPLTHIPVPDLGGYSGNTVGGFGNMIKNPRLLPI